MKLGNAYDHVFFRIHIPFFYRLVLVKSIPEPNSLVMAAINRLLRIEIVQSFEFLSNVNSMHSSLQGSTKGAFLTSSIDGTVKSQKL